MGAGTSGPLTLVPRRAGVAISHRSGHTHVDSDHVLLGLLIIDGESAKQLRAAWVNLDPARTAMAAMAPDGNCRLTLSLRVDRGGRHRLLDRADDKTTAIRLNLIAQALAQAS